jgi:glycerophosphoryl diester phosphodiesterase
VSGLGLAVALALVSAPGPQRAVPHPPPRVEVYGHRGARARRPENTLAAFRYALEQGVDALELDLAVTADDVLVVSHDPIASAERCVGGPVVIRATPLAELRKLDCGSRPHPRFPEQIAVPGAPIPTLAEVLELVRSSTLPAARRVQLDVETKLFPAHPELAPSPEAFATLVVRALRGAGLARRSIVQSFDHRSLAAVKRRAPEIRVAMLFAESLPDHVAVARALGAEIVSPHHEWITADSVRACHRAGIRVAPWTVNDAATTRRMVELGVDAIITDDPAAVAATLAALGRR